MKNVPFIITIFILSCNLNSEKTKEIQLQIVESNLYDLYYLKLLEKNLDFKTKNIDSLRTQEIKEEFLEEVIDYLALDSIYHNKIKSNIKLDNSVVKITISDSIKRKIKDRNVEVMDFFSKPIQISNFRKGILFETHHQLGRSNGIVLFTENKKGLWEVDSTVVLNNYRGGGLVER
ncbi:hypothetical protein [Croceivirga sp. JEA036]|uniref:hypothetical protein n=1 Tax=Croceivirga sp. JEA036 TaxID=2721162 RepID=UPI001438BA33|nr:hypothetical protein [Croceivirga sp. JEA036]NJB37018.1 hypothetical protein [Croceivirga sp. JEA036]